MELPFCFTTIFAFFFAFLSLKMYLWWIFIYLVFTRMPGDSYRRRLRSLLSYLCYVFRALINSLVCWFCLVLNKVYSYTGIINSTNNNKYRKHKSNMIMSVLHCCSVRRQTPHGIGCILQKCRNLAPSSGQRHNTINNSETLLNTWTLLTRRPNRSRWKKVAD